MTAKCPEDVRPICVWVFAMIYFIIYCARIWPGPWLEHDIKNQRKATKWCPNNTLFKYHCYTKVGYGFCFGRSVLLSYEPNLRRSRALITKSLNGWARFKRISWQFRCALSGQAAKVSEAEPEWPGKVNAARVKQRKHMRLRLFRGAPMWSWLYCKRRCGQNYAPEEHAAGLAHQKETWLRLCCKAKCGSDYAATENVTHVTQETPIWLKLCRKNKCGLYSAAARHVGYFQTQATSNVGGALGNGVENLPWKRHPIFSSNFLCSKCKWYSENSWIFLNIPEHSWIFLNIPENSWTYSSEK